MNSQLLPLTNFGQGLAFAHPAFVSSPARGEVGCHAFGFPMWRGAAAGFTSSLAGEDSKSKRDEVEFMDALGEG